MNDPLRAYVIRAQRRAIIMALRPLWPGSIEGYKLFRSLLGQYPEYEKRYCIKDLYYLEEKGYLIRKSPLTGQRSPEEPWSEAKWTLTALGNELANSLTGDPALEL